MNKWIVFISCVFLVSFTKGYSRYSTFGGDYIQINDAGRFEHGNSSTGDIRAIYCQGQVEAIHGDTTFLNVDSVYWKSKSSITCFCKEREYFIIRGDSVLFKGKIYTR